jgi:hypothetical protein
MADDDELTDYWNDIRADRLPALSRRAGVPVGEARALFHIVEASPYNLGEHWRVRAQVRGGTRPVRLEALFLSRRNVIVHVSEYETFSDEEVRFCIYRESADDQNSYVGEAALDVSGHMLIPVRTRRE